MSGEKTLRLAAAAPDVERLLNLPHPTPPKFAVADIERQTLRVAMRDGVRLATELYLPPLHLAPVVAARTPYGRTNPKTAAVMLTLAQHGYIGVSQDCRGTGESEPDDWDYYVYEKEDSSDFVEWVNKQSWFDGFLGGCGSSYLAQTQWCMALHPGMSTIVPEVGGLGIAHNSARRYMFLNSFSRSVGKGDDKVPVALDVLEREMLPETLAGGFFNDILQEPLAQALLDRFPHLKRVAMADAQHWLWKHYCTLEAHKRAELIKQAVGENSVTMNSVESLSSVFGHRIAHDAHTIPCTDAMAIMDSLHAPALMITGWYDWGLNDALATWDSICQLGHEPMRSHSRLLITPSAHNTSGYHEGRDSHPELDRTYRNVDNTELLLRWYTVVRDGTYESWPTVIYYLMGANEWHCSSAWPPREAEVTRLYLAAEKALTAHCAVQDRLADHYTFDPENPTPTVGGSILSFVYRAGSVDVREVQKRDDVLTYTTAPLDRPTDIVGPVRLILYVSSSAVDTDFTARLSDVFPDGRAIHIQSGMLRARYRGREPELLVPGQIYCLEIDMCATANRFEAGHCIRLDIASADFPNFDRNSNRGGDLGPPIKAIQTVYRDASHPSHLEVSILRAPKRGHASVHQNGAESPS
jgi:putative CocE/NonD family hydrolase